MVFAVQCPDAKCRKYQMVEDANRGKETPCLICGKPIRVGGTAAPPADKTVPPPADKTVPPPRRG